MLSFIVVLSLIGCAFGAPQIDGRIVGGVDADIKDIPFQVSLQVGSFHSCGGSIINANTILTAAHCVDGANPSRYQIRVGSSLKSSGGQLYSVSKFISHPNYNFITFDYDVAIVKLSSNIVFGVGVSAIPLPSATLNIPVGAKVTVSGWGTLASGGSSPERLQVVTVPVVDQEVCADALFNYFVVTKRHLCASEGGRDACQGDSGGPLVYNGQVAGIVSWGWGCADARYPGVYARVSEVVTWINQQL